MTYSTKLADRIRETLMDLPNVTEKEMFRGICFMVDDKLCICVSDNEMLCRIGAEEAEKALENNDVRQMISRDKPMKDYVYVSEEAWHNQKDFDNWIKLCLDFNPKAKASKKKSK
jgi:TfoX/Sxy family transcriptional regulator of competence genes